LGPKREVPPCIKKVEKLKNNKKMRKMFIGNKCIMKEGKVSMKNKEQQ
jgi:hypothetical protein